MSTTELTIEEVQESITGFDEIAVEQHMGMDIYTDAEAKPILLLRALVFVHQVHELKPAPEARKAALGMTLKEVQGYFAEPPEEIDEDEPDTEAGKGDSQPATGPTD